MTKISWIINSLALAGVLRKYSVDEGVDYQGMMKVCMEYPGPASCRDIEPSRIPI